MRQARKRTSWSRTFAWLVLLLAALSGYAFFVIRPRHLMYPRAVLELLVCAVFLYVVRGQIRRTFGRHGR